MNMPMFYVSFWTDGFRYFEMPLCGGPLESRIWEKLAGAIYRRNRFNDMLYKQRLTNNSVLWNWKYCNLLKSMKHGDLFRYNVLTLDM